METLQPHGAADSAKVLDGLLRGEIAAAKAYKKALDRGPSGPRFGSSVVKSIELEHGHAIKELRELVIAAGGQPSTDSGLWGTLTTTVEGAARLAGDSAALKALKKGEEIGLKRYETAVGDERVMPSARNFIRETLVPQTRSHIIKLSQLLQAT